MTNSSSLVDWGVAMRLLPGQAVSGDWYLVEPLEQRVLLVVVDGLGHGEEAAFAARVAIDNMHWREGDTIISLLQRGHEKLQGTRGVVASAAVFNSRDRTLTWGGIGNVLGVLIRMIPMGMGVEQEHLLSRAGVMGHVLPPPSASIVPISRGDTVILATDGVRSGFTERIRISSTPQRIANEIIEQEARDTDDALVLVARYQGSSG